MKSNAQPRYFSAYPLKAIQQYETVLTDEKLAEIQAEFDKIPAKS